MRNYFIIFIFIFFVNCLFGEVALAEMKTTKMSLEDIEEAETKMSKAVVDASTIDPKKIERALMKQLGEGKSGLTNLAGVETLMAEISSFQNDKRQSIVAAASTGEDLSILSKIIVNSDSEQSLELMQGVMDSDTGNASLLMNEIMSGEGEKADFDIFSHIAAGADTENFEALRETIVTGMIEDQSIFATDTMAQMMKVSDAETGSYLVNEITNIEPTDTGENLSMNVLASFTEIASEKMSELYQQDPTMMDALTTNAFENATEQDIGMMSIMMQNTTGRNTAMLMQSMVAYNPEMMGDVYNNLAEQDYDLFEHIESAKMEMQADPYYDPATGMPDPAMTPGYDPYYDPGMPEDMQAGAMYYQEQFFDDLKGDIFSEIINHSEGIASETAADMMMHAGGNSAMYMMENMMHENPEMMTQVMDNFMQEDFDVFYHMETSMDPMAITPAYDPATGMPNTEMNPDYDPNIEGPAIMSDMRDFQTDIIGTMMDYGGEQAMETMAYMMTTGDGANSTMILESVMEHTMMDPMMEGDMYYDPYMMSDPYAMDPTMMDPMMMGPGMGGEANMALALLDEMAEIDPDMMADIYDQQADLMDNMFDTAFSNASAEDASMIADIVASGVHGDMAEMMFNNLADMDAGQDFMAEVFYDIAEQSPETLIAMAEMDQGLYETIAYDPYYDKGGMSAADLMQNIMMDAGYGTDPYDMGYGGGFNDPYMDDPYMMGGMYDPYMDDPYYDPYMDDPYYDPYMDDPYMMGGMYDPYMMGGMYDPYMMGGGYDPYFAGFGDPYMMGGMYDPYYYDPYMMGGMYDPYYDPWMDPMRRDDDPDDDTHNTSYLGYPSYAAWCVATNCNVGTPGLPTWGTNEGSLGYSKNRAFFPGSVISDLSLSAMTHNSGVPQYEMISGSLPPGLRFDATGSMAYIQGTITPAGVIDTLTFDGSETDFNLIGDTETTLDTITFSGREDTLLTLNFTGGQTYYLRKYNNDTATYEPYTYAHGDEANLVITLTGGSVIDSADYDIVDDQITFDRPMSSTGFNDTLNLFDFDGSDTYNLEKYDAATTSYVPYYTADDDKTNLIVRERDVATLVVSTVDSDLYEVTGGQIQFDNPRDAPIAAVPSTSLNTFSFDGSDTYNLEKYDAATFTNVPYYTADDDKTNLTVRERDVATLVVSTVDSDLYEVTSGQIQFDNPRDAPIAAVPSTNLNTFSFDGSDTYNLEKYDAATMSYVPYYTADDDKTNLTVRKRNVATSIVTLVDSDLYEVTGGQIQFNDPQDAPVAAVNDTGIQDDWDGIQTTFNIEKYDAATFTNEPYYTADGDATNLIIKISNGGIPSTVIPEVGGVRRYQVIDNQVEFINGYMPPNGFSISSINYSRSASGSEISSINYSRPASGSEISSINYSRPASGSELSTITYTASGTSVNTVEYSTASVGPYDLELDGSSYTTANNDKANVEIVIDDVALNASTYNISNGQITFTAGNEKSANDEIDSIKHSQSSIALENVQREELTVEINGVLQDPDTYEIFGENNDKIRFDTAPANGATTTAFLRTEDGDTDYTFDIRATDPQNSEYSDRTFSMFFNRPGIAWIKPQRPLTTIVEVPFVRTAGIIMNQTVNFTAATYNKSGGTYENVTLSLAAGSLAGSGLTLSGSTNFNSVTGVADRMLTGRPTSFEYDTDYNITVRAQEDEASYNSERTLTIRVLADPNYYSPAS